MQPLVRRIELRDKDLGRQLRRASCSIALNTAEGMYSPARVASAQLNRIIGTLVRLVAA
jgi:four helix bundle protein